MTLFWAKLIWALGLIGWFAIRYPHDRRSRRTPRVVQSDRARDLARLTISFTGMCLLPATYVLTGEPKLADYPFQPALAWIGAAVLTLPISGVVQRNGRGEGHFPGRQHHRRGQRVLLGGQGHDPGKHRCSEAGATSCGPARRLGGIAAVIAVDRRGAVRKDFDTLDGSDGNARQIDGVSGKRGRSGGSMPVDQHQCSALTQATQVCFRLALTRGPDGCAIACNRLRYAAYRITGREVLRQRPHDVLDGAEAAFVDGVSIDHHDVGSWIVGANA